VAQKMAARERGEGHGGRGFGLGKVRESFRGAKGYLPFA
jgi:hypothetical protein